MKLKPCPFCGAKPKLVSYMVEKDRMYYVGCKNKECVNICETGVSLSKQKTIDKWNKRHETTNN